MKNLIPALALTLLLVSCETTTVAPPAPARESLLDLVETQNLDKIRNLFGLDQDVNSTNDAGQTALHLAATRDLADIAAVLLARGARVDQADLQGNTALHLAVKNGSATVLPILVQYGASLFSVDAQGKNVVQTALQQNPALVPKLITQANLGSKDAQGNTVLHLAAAQGLESLVDVILPLGPDQGLRNNAGHTALDEALLFPKSQAHASVAWKLIRQGAPRTKATDVDYYWQLGAADNPNLVFESGQTGLHYAASRGHTGLLRQLIALGAHANAVDQPGNTALHRAIENGDLEAAALLLDQGANIDAQDFNGNSTLHLALTSRLPVEGTTFLLDRGAKANPKNAFGMTPLHMVVGLGLPSDLARALVAKGADVNARNKMGNSALLDAVKEANEGLIKALLSLGANPFAGNNADESPVTESVKAGVTNLGWLITEANKGLRDDNGDSALHVTVRMGDYPAAVAYLLSIGTNPNERNKKGQSPLHLALEARNLGVAQALFQAGSDLFLVDNAGVSPLTQVFQGPVAFAEAFLTPNVIEARDPARNTPLFHAVFQANLPMAQLLIKRGANVRARNLAGSSVLHEAVRLGDLTLATALVKGGAEVNGVDAFGNTPLHAIVATDSVALGDMLVANGADPRIRNKEGRSALHEAVRLGGFTSATWLVQKKADPNTRDNLGRTPLFDAVQGGNPAMVGLLLGAGSGVNLRDSTGSTAVHLAALGSNQAVADQLVAAGADLFAENASGITPVVVSLRGTSENWKVFVNARNVNNQNNQGQSALHLAILGGVGLPAVQYLVSLGADLQVRNKDGKTPEETALAAGRTDLLPALRGRG